MIKIIDNLICNMIYNITWVKPKLNMNINIANCNYLINVHFY